MGHALDVSVAGICAGNFPAAGDVCVAVVVTEVVVDGAGIVGVVGVVFAVVAVVVVTGAGIVGKTTGGVVVTNGALSTG